MNAPTAAIAYYCLIRFIYDMSSMQDWAIEKLSVFLGFDPETLREQVYPYLVSIDSSNELVEHLTNLLGSNEDTNAFIQEFVNRRFPPALPTLATSRSPSLNNSRSNSPKPTTAASQTQTNPAVLNQAFGNDKNVYRKKDFEEDYYSGSTKAKKDTKLSTDLTQSAQHESFSDAPRTTSASSATTLRINSQPRKSTLTSDKLEPKKKKASDIMNLEDALKELNIQTTISASKKRQPCQCQATKHELLTISPNCLTCGKIICIQEGTGPCTFCGTPVLSKEQQVELIAEAKRKRAETAREKNRQLHKKSVAPGASHGTSRYAAKLSGAVVSDRSDDWLGPAEWEEQQRQAEQARLDAERHKEKLLDFQRSSAKRTTVIDQATDYELPSDGGNIWLTAEEKAMQVKRQQANLKKLENTNKRKVMTIDLATRNVVMEEASESDESEDEYADVKMTPAQRTYLQRQKELHNPKRTAVQSKAEVTEGSSGTYAQNPYLNRMDAPTFIRGAIPAKAQKKSAVVEKAAASSSKASSSRKKASSRVQDSRDMHNAEQLMIGGEDGNREVSVEPACG